MVLHQLQRPLRLRAQILRAELTQLETGQKSLLAQGRAAGSLAQQRILARQIKRQQDEMRLLKQRLARVERQLSLLNRLLLMRESVAAVQAVQQNGLLQQIDWTAVQHEFTILQAEESGQMALLTAVLKQMEAAVPPIILPPPSPPAAGLVLVERVIDGDTIVIEGGERVRYIGMDCPEMRGWNGRPEPYAQTATKRNRQLVDGKKVRLTKDVSERDRFGRLLRYVYVDNLFVNAQLVRDGLAYAFPLHPDTSKAAEFERLEAEARRLRRGIWQ